MTATINVILNLIQNQLDPARPLADRFKTEKRERVKNIFYLEF